MNAETTDKLNIDKMEAGREMNAMIAKEIMGWENIVDWLWKGEGAIPWWVNDDSSFAPKSTHKRFCPSTDPAAMMLMLDMIGCYSLTLWGPDKRCIAFVGEYAVEASAETMPLAACRAALKWAGRRG